MNYLRKQLSKLRNKLWESPRAQNIALWILLLELVNITAHFEVETTIAERFGVIVGVCFLLALPIYITNLWILPLWHRRQYALGGLIYFINLSFFAAAGPFIVYGITIGFCFLFSSEVMPFEDFNMGRFVSLLGTLAIATMFGVAVRIARDSILQTNKNQAAELKLLKAQLNPHFLFNTLNNLYGLSVTKSDKLPGLMLQLSDLLRYSLYDTQEQWVLLAKEVKYIENYITLEQLRLEDEGSIDFTMEGHANQQRIAPMLLIVFLENAFKHFGASADVLPRIKIKLVITENALQFSCYNSKDDDITVSPRPQNTSGIGLANVRKRLDLLYPEAYELVIQNESASFNVHLELQLDSFAL